VARVEYAAGEGTGRWRARRVALRDLPERRTTSEGTTMMIVGAILLFLAGVLIGGGVAAHLAREDRALCERQTRLAREWRALFLEYGWHYALCADMLASSNFVCVCGLSAARNRAHAESVADALDIPIPEIGGAP
jgi:hypothetical protein